MKEEKLPLLIVDGNNLILAEPFFPPDPQSSTFLADCRHWLQSRLQAMAAVKINIIAVYDGEKERAFEWGRLTTIYTLVADGVIMNIIREAKGLIAVVTSDRALKEAAKDYGALTIQSEDFSEFLLERFPSWFQTDDPWSAVVKPLALQGIQILEGEPKMAWEKVANVVVLFGGDEVRFVTAYEDRVVWNLLANPDNPETAFLIIEDGREIALQTYRDHSALLKKVGEAERVASGLQAIQGDAEVTKLATEKAAQAKELRAQLSVNLFPYGREREAEAKITYIFASGERGSYPKLILKDTSEEGEPSDLLWVVRVNPPSEDKHYPSIAVGIGGWISPRWVGKKNGGDTNWKYLVLGNIEVVQTDSRDEEGRLCVRVSSLNEEDRVEEKLFYSVEECPGLPAVGAALVEAVKEANNQSAKPKRERKSVGEMPGEEVESSEASEAEPS